jgi:hypothetical protein
MRRGMRGELSVGAVLRIVARRCTSDCAMHVMSAVVHVRSAAVLIRGTTVPTRLPLEAQARALRQGRATVVPTNDVGDARERFAGAGSVRSRGAAAVVAVAVSGSSDTLARWWCA